MRTLYYSQSLRKIEAEFATAPLMQRAGAAAAALARRLCSSETLPILILAGPGNNGGDAFVAANTLRQHEQEVVLVFNSDPARQPADAAAALACFQAAGGQWLTDIPCRPRWGLIMDGLFGIGLSSPPRPPYADWIEQAAQLAARDGCPVLALDCPSGLNADSGQAFTPILPATHTLSFIGHKPGLLTLDGPDFCGQLELADLDIQPATPADGHCLHWQDFEHALPLRQHNSHKGTHGTAGIWGGNTGMIGAALLAGRAALQSGSGKVIVALLAPHAPTIDPIQPELMFPAAHERDKAPLSALACGPGLGQDEAATAMLEAALASPFPLVLDADALNLIAHSRQLQTKLAERRLPNLLTPHPAEAARLLGTSTSDVQAARIVAAQTLAHRFNAAVALKGCGTVIAESDGRWWINPTGNAGLATAGSGDVLTGIIVALLAQGVPALAALQAGVYVHGAAADALLQQGIGPIGLTAGELIPAARHLLNRHQRAHRF